MGAISELKLDTNYCKARGYDGSAAVSGSKSGMTAHLVNKNPKAIYIQCFCHRLSLSICKTHNIQNVSIIMEQIKKLLYFFNFWGPRQRLLLECIELFALNADKKN